MKRSRSSREIASATESPHASPVVAQTRGRRFRPKPMVPLVLLVTVAALCSAGAAKATEPVECADDLLASLRNEFGITGMAVAVKRGDRMIYSRSSGEAHVELGVPVTSSTIFQLSSTAKIFAGIATMRLVEQDKLRLSDPVSKHLDGAPEAWSAVTVRHLLSMTARLPDLTELSGTDPGGPQDEILARVLDQGKRQVMTSLFELAPNPDPGTGWRYGSGDFFVLQQILEGVAGKPFEEIVREQVFEPAGMLSATYWSSDDQLVPGSATGYYPDGEGGLVHRRFTFPQELFSAGGAATNLEDLLRLDDAIRDRRLLSKASLESMWTWQPLVDGNVVSYALGWDPKDHAPGQYSIGQGGGYLTSFRRYDTGDLTVIVLTNGFTIDFRFMNPDNLATAVAAVWEPAIAGLEEPGCSFEAIRRAQF